MRYRSSRVAKRQIPVRRVPEKAEYTHTVSATTVNILRNGNRVNQLNLGVAASSVSCGVCEVYSVTNIQNLSNLPKSVVQSAVKALITSIKRNRNSAYAIASNNDRTEWGNSILDAICVTKTEYKRNPNSESDIKVWLL